MRFSAGLLPYRSTDQGAEVFLVHMAGPIWGHRDDGSWSLAKGEYEPGLEDPADVAAREFTEEVGIPVPSGDWVDLGDVYMPRSHKTVRTYAVATAEHLAFVSSNLFEMEWPRGSGRIQQYPETDGAAWFSLAKSRSKILSGQLPILDLLEDHLAADAG